MKTWVIVADAARARFLSVENNEGAYHGSAASPSSKPVMRGALEEIKELLNPAGRMSDQDLTSDRPGSTADRMGEALHAYEPANGPKDIEASRFAQEVVKELEGAYRTKKMDRFYLMAAPRFLGMLRDQMNTGLKQALVTDIAKDYSCHNPAAIRAALPERL